MRKIKKIKLSSTFMARSGVCKFCLQPPKYYYSLYPLAKNRSFKDYSFDLKFKRSLSKIIKHDLYYLDPLDYSVVHNNSYCVPDKSYVAAKHYAKSSDVQDLTEYVTCSCAKSCWSFAYLTKMYKPEIRFRKAPKTYPYKFNS